MSAGELHHLSYVIISDCHHHDTVAVHLFQRNLIEFLRERFGSLPRKIFYFTDGAAAQYKNRKNFVNLCQHEEDFGVAAEWHFFATSHGKGACDGVGGTVKRYCNTFQLMHMPRGNHAQSIASNGDKKEDKTLLQHPQLRQHGEFRHVSVSERQRLWPCGQNLHVPFLRTVLPPEVDGALEQWWPTARQKRSYLHHQGEFQHDYFDFVSLHHSDHDGVVRIFVHHSEIVKRLLINYLE